MHSPKVIDDFSIHFSIQIIPNLQEILSNWSDSRHAEKPSSPIRKTMEGGRELLIDQL
jgi:hypothetical protein